MSLGYVNFLLLFVGFRIRDDFQRLVKIFFVIIYYGLQQVKYFSFNAPQKVFVLFFLFSGFSLPANIDLHKESKRSNEIHLLAQGLEVCPFIHQNLACSGNFFFNYFKRYPVNSPSRIIVIARSEHCHHGFLTLSELDSLFLRFDQSNWHLSPAPKLEKIEEFTE